MDTVRGSIDRPPVRTVSPCPNDPYRIVSVSPYLRGEDDRRTSGRLFMNASASLFVGGIFVAPLGCKAVNSSGYIFSVDRNCSGRATTGLHDDSRGADLRRKGLRGCQRDVGRSARVADTVRGRASTLP